MIFCQISGCFNSARFGADWPASTFSRAASGGLFPVLPERFREACTILKSPCGGSCRAAYLRLRPSCTKLEARYGSLFSALLGRPRPAYTALKIRFGRLHLRSFRRGQSVCTRPGPSCGRPYSPVLCGLPAACTFLEVRSGTPFQRSPERRYLACTVSEASLRGPKLGLYPASPGGVCVC